MPPRSVSDLMTVPGTFASAAASTLAFVSPVNAVSPGPGPPPGAPGGACWFVGAVGVVADPLPAASAIAAPAAPAAAVAAMIAVSLVGIWDMAAQPADAPVTSP